MPSLRRTRLSLELPFYNGKLFGICGREHSKIVLNIFLIGSNTITFQENACKTFHGDLTDLKYMPREVLQTCNHTGEKHDRC